MNNINYQRRFLTTSLCALVAISVLLSAPSLIAEQTTINPKKRSSSKVNNRNSGYRVIEQEAPETDPEGEPTELGFLEFLELLFIYWNPPTSEAPDPEPFQLDPEAANSEPFQLNPEAPNSGTLQPVSLTPNTDTPFNSDFENLDLITDFYAPYLTNDPSAIAPTSDEWNSDTNSVTPSNGGDSNNLFSLPTDPSSVSTTPSLSLPLQLDSPEDDNNKNVTDSNNNSSINSDLSPVLFSSTNSLSPESGNDISISSNGPSGSEWTSGITSDNPNNNSGDGGENSGSGENNSGSSSADNSNNSANNDNSSDNSNNSSDPSGGGSDPGDGGGGDGDGD